MSLEQDLKAAQAKQDELFRRWSVHWVNSAGLSLSNRRLLGEIVEGLGAVGLQDQRGKPVHVRLKEVPP